MYIRRKKERKKEQTNTNSSSSSIRSSNIPSFCMDRKKHPHLFFLRINIPFNFLQTDRDGAAARHWTRILELLGSNLGHEISYPEFLRGFPQSLQTNVEIVPRLSHSPSLIKCKAVNLSL
jgi:hypothetical protein